jgi:hypothetical protein
MSTPRLNVTTATAASERIWEEEIIPRMHDYIRIPNKSPSFDKEWVKSGHMDKAVKRIREIGARLRAGGWGREAGEGS